MKILAAMCALLFSAGSMFGQGAVRRDTAITAVTGESWLHHLHRSFDETSMGKTFRLGPPDPATDLAAPHLRSSSMGTRTLHGSDLYRLNCQGCHGESGLGAPPEIGSVINPVRATSSVLVSERMKKAGMEISRRQTAELVSQSRDLLLKRLHEGGQDMPSFHYLSEAEIRSLVAYLKQLAGVPGAEKDQVAIQESPDRIGELIVKSTCHTCHGATGLNPTSAELFEGAIPPLSVFPVRVSRAELVRKVTSGAPVVMGTPSSAYRGRMPVFSYLTEDEAADIYKYLTRYPPVELASVNHGAEIQGAETSRPDANDWPADPSGARATAPHPALQTAPQAAPSQDRVTREPAEPVALWMGVGLCAAVLLGLMCWITWRELRRLAVESQIRRECRRAMGPAPWVTLRPTVEMIVESPELCVESAERSPSGWVPERRIS
jgi:mono/diheme cytochrome c family protein